MTIDDFDQQQARFQNHQLQSTIVNVSVSVSFVVNDSGV
jgi:hypothetical protein